MSQPRIFTLDPGHVSLANYLVALWNELRIYFPAIGDVEIALPGFYQSPQRAERFGAMVS